MAEGPFGRSTEHPKYGSHLMQEAITNVDPQLSKSVVILASVARQIHRRPLPPIPQLMPVSGERVAPRGWVTVQSVLDFSPLRPQRPLRERIGGLLGRLERLFSTNLCVLRVLGGKIAPQLNGYVLSDPIDMRRQ